MESKMNNSNIDKQFAEYLERLQGLYQASLWSYYIYEWLEEVRAPNIVGQENAEKNVKIWKQYNNFFTITRQATNAYFFLELTKLFDTQEQALKIAKLINIAKNNKKRLKKKDNAPGLGDSDLVEINNLLEENKYLIKKLKDYRDEHICHEDINKNSISINWEEINKLMGVIARIFNTFSLKLYSSSTWFDWWKEDFKSTVKKLFEDLKRFQKYKHRERWESALKWMTEEQKKEIMNMPIVREQCEI